jgi:hypothetical protein
MTNPKAQDPGSLTTVDLTEGWQVDHFTRELGISREELAKAVEAAGPRLEDLREYLRRYGPPATSE